tara:strand:- start:42 stop:347 length:306 start_codon:yes stop_codon:yes gene_type:complete
MKKVFTLFKWILISLIFFILFSFALDNRQEGVVYLFFGRHWQGPQILILLVTFIAGLILGLLALFPSYWKLRRRASQLNKAINLPLRSEELFTNTRDVNGF